MKYHESMQPVTDEWTVITGHQPPCLDVLQDVDFFSRRTSIIAFEDRQVLKITEFDAADTTLMSVKFEIQAQNLREGR